MEHVYLILLLRVVETTKIRAISLNKICQGQTSGCKTHEDIFVASQRSSNAPATGRHDALNTQQSGYAL